MLDYPAKILMALAMTFEENGDQFRQWLIDNSYPELAALSDAIKGSKERPIAISVSRGLYHIIRTIAPTNVSELSRIENVFQR